MHHRRNRKPRREIKRQGHHEARRAAQRALEGGTAAVVRGEHYSGSMPQPPLPDRPSTGKKTKKAKKIAYCPGREGNKRHEYLTDTEMVMMPAWRTWNRTAYSYERTYKLCVHCGVERHVKGNRYW